MEVSLNGVGDWILQARPGIALEVTRDFSRSSSSPSSSSPPHPHNHKAASLSVTSAS
jgi:hypothetical protein